VAEVITNNADRSMFCHQKMFQSTTTVSALDYRLIYFKIHEIQSAIQFCKKNTDGIDSYLTHCHIYHCEDSVGVYRHTAGVNLVHGCHVSHVAAGRGRQAGATRRSRRSTWENDGCCSWRRRLERVGRLCKSSCTQ